MPGIVSYGAYIPPTRLGFSVIGGRPPKDGGPERAVAWNDEDAVTMAVAAAANALRGFDRGGVDALFFASTTYAFKEKQGAALIAKALDLRRDVAHHGRVGLAARGHRCAARGVRRGGGGLGAARARDRERLPARRARLGAGAGLRRRRGGVPGRRAGRDRAARRRARHRRRDRRRLARGGRPLRALVGRALRGAGGLHARRHARRCSGLLAKRIAASAADFTKAALYAPDARSHAGAARGAEARSRARSWIRSSASSATRARAFAPLLLAAALESAKPGDRILLASYGDGAEAFAFARDAAPREARAAPRRRLAPRAAPRRRELRQATCAARSLDATRVRAPAATPGLSATIHFRERDEDVALQGPALQPLRRAPVPDPARLRALLREGRLRARAARRPHRQGRHLHLRLLLPDARPADDRDDHRHRRRARPSPARGREARGREDRSARRARRSAASTRWAGGPTTTGRRAPSAES